MCGEGFASALHRRGLCWQRGAGFAERSYALCRNYATPCAASRGLGRSHHLRSYAGAKPVLCKADITLCSETEGSVAFGAEPRRGWRSYVLRRHAQALVERSCAYAQYMHDSRLVVAGGEGSVATPLRGHRLSRTLRGHRLSRTLRGHRLSRTLPAPRCRKRGCELAGGGVAMHGYA